MAQSDLDEEPLDPAMLRVQQKLRRLMLIGGLTMAIGIAAVFAAMVYRITTLDDNDGTPLADFVLPDGATLVSSALDGDRALLTYQHAGGTLLVLVDIGDGAILGEAGLTGRGTGMPTPP